MIRNTYNANNYSLNIPELESVKTFTIEEIKKWEVGHIEVGHRTFSWHDFCVEPITVTLVHKSEDYIVLEYHKLEFIYTDKYRALLTPEWCRIKRGDWDGSMCYECSKVDAIDKIDIISMKNQNIQLSALYKKDCTNFFINFITKSIADKKMSKNEIIEYNYEGSAVSDDIPEFRYERFTYDSERFVYVDSNKQPKLPPKRIKYKNIDLDLNIIYTKSKIIDIYHTNYEYTNIFNEKTVKGIDTQILMECTGLVAEPKIGCTKTSIHELSTWEFKEKTLLMLLNLEDYYMCRNCTRFLPNSLVQVYNKDTLNYQTTVRDQCELNINQSRGLTPYSPSCSAFTAQNFYRKQTILYMY